MDSGLHRISQALLFMTFIVGLAIAQNSNQDYLNAHNSARAEVGVGPLSWDDSVASYAQQYANQRMDDCNLVHSGGPYGENIAWSSANLSGVDAVKMWVGEKDNYDYNSNTCAAGQVCGHYTQVVWQNSVRVGCAKVQCNNGKGTFIGCNYDPPGNVNGRRPY
ncbi:pathogenesis-related protein 1C-like [Humulus lupulus]|uniref:pathogenesis-related protein 1C-like n=1 Tax=Humulus lupulus TaxID=3486 RepID=UPI002B4144BF|nr:pathogenesis-related protein 1C-like [Humulus lupulus]